MTIIVCPLSKVEEMVALHQPERVISLLDPEYGFPELGSDYQDRHLRLGFHDITEAYEDYVMPCTDHIRDVLQFVRAWDGSNPILIHCRAGISRSTAVAYIIACFANPELDEHEIAANLRRAAPLARPNFTLIELADREMGRNGRMCAAIKQTGRDLPWIEVEENEPFRLLIARARQSDAE
jgi:predicted protein tyrosine phosphatase